MTFTVVYGEFPQTRNYFWSLKIHAKGCGNIKNDVRKYGYREAKQHTWDYNTIREIAVDYWQTISENLWTIMIPKKRLSKVMSKKLWVLLAPVQENYSRINRMNLRRLLSEWLHPTM